MKSKNSTILKNNSLQMKQFNERGKIMSKSALVITAAVLFSIFAAPADAIDIPPGPVYGIWDPQWNPYRIQGDIYVPSGYSLIIMPDVEVRFQGHYKFEIFGLLNAEGTEEDTIRFTAEDSLEGWCNLRFSNSGQPNSLKYCKIQFGNPDGSTPEDNWGGAIYIDSSRVTVENCLIRENTAILGGGIYIDSDEPVSITENTITNCIAGGGSGIHCENSCSDVVISGNDIIENTGPYYPFNAGGGIKCVNSNPQVTGNYIVNNIGDHGGITCDGSSPTIIGNIIKYNNIGGGIRCLDGSDPTIKDNFIANNEAYVVGMVPGAGLGAGIHCDGSSPSIVENILSGNDAYDGYYDLSAGGGLYLEESAAEVRGNLIIENEAHNGGGIYCYNCVSTLQLVDNLIIGNIAEEYGGGIRCWNSDPTIEGCKIYMNQAIEGGGMHLDGDALTLTGSDPSIEHSLICANIAATRGGGIRAENSSSPYINKCAACYNEANSFGGGFDFDLSSGLEDSMVNSIFWGNTPNQYYHPTPILLQVSYCIIQGGGHWTWPGIIDEDPLFVDSDLLDFRIEWDSPAIDDGSPSAAYYDPDSTRADIGAFYYDQSMPQRVLMTPADTPCQIDPSGGIFDYSARVTNISSGGCTSTIWIDVIVPNDSNSEPIIGPATIGLPATSTITQDRNQFVPSRSPWGIYCYNVYAVVDADTSMDSFWIIKLPEYGLSDGLTGWPSGLKLFGDMISANANVSPRNFVIANHPNPFNPTTTISYSLPEAARVELTVYDIRGRTVARLVNGWREAGLHEVTFDGSRLASGVYIYRLNSGSFQAQGKMVLMK